MKKISLKYRGVTAFLILILTGLMVFGGYVGVTGEEPAHTELAPVATLALTPTGTLPQALSPVVTATPEPSPLVNTPTATARPSREATTTPTSLPPSPTPTATPTLPPTPVVTPTLTTAALVARLHHDAELRERVCGPDLALTPAEGQALVPILLYHFVGRASLEHEGVSTTRYNVTKQDFEVQLALLHYLGYQTVTVGEVVAAIRGEGVLPDRPIALTIDDGWREQYTHFFPLLQRYGMKATFYVPSSYPVGGRFVTWEELQTLVDAGMEIGSHTHKHVDLTTVGEETAWWELATSKHILEEKLGITVQSIAYPFGNYTGGTVALAQQAGYQAAVALGPTVRQSAGNLYALNRMEVFGNRSPADLVSRLPWRGADTALCAPFQPVRPLLFEE